MILLPEICANICFGGTKRDRLFMAAGQSLYSLYVETPAPIFVRPLMNADKRGLEI